MTQRLIQRVASMRMETKDVVASESPNADLQISMSRRDRQMQVEGSDWQTWLVVLMLAITQVCK